MSTADPEKREPRITEKGHRKGLPPPNKGRKLPAEALTADELQRLMASFDMSTKRGVRNAAITALMARAGLKVGQVIAMQRWHYEYGSHVVTVPAGSSKNATERKVPIDAVTRRLLDEWWHVRRDLKTPHRAPLFAAVNKGSIGNPIHSAYVREMLREAAEKLRFDKRISPQGLKKTYELRAAERSARIDAQLTEHIDEAAFAGRYPVAYEKWRDAFDLYELGPERHATRIGHDCRDAINAFAADLVRLHDLEIEQAVSTTKNTVRAAFAAQSGGSKRVHSFLNALLAYWEALIGLVMRQDHAGERPRSPVDAEDSRRLVFHTLIVMAEIDSALRGASSSDRSTTETARDVR